MTDLPYWVAFTRVASVGSVRAGLLEKHFGSLEAAWQAPANELRAAGVGPAVANAIATVRSRVDPLQEMERLAGLGVQPLTWHDAGYPHLLREIPDPPPVLFVKGTLGPPDERLVTVVGTPPSRRPSRDRRDRRQRAGSRHRRRCPSRGPRTRRPHLGGPRLRYRRHLSSRARRPG